MAETTSAVYAPEAFDSGAPNSMKMKARIQTTAGRSVWVLRNLWVLMTGLSLSGPLAFAADSANANGPPAVAGPSQGTGQPAASEPAPALAPRPFGMDAIRASMPKGTIIRLAMSKKGGDSVVQQWEVTEWAQESCTIASKIFSPGGELLKDEGAETSTWKELEGHASFPAVDTILDDVEVEVGAGHFAVKRYRVARKKEDGTPQTHVFLFAKNLPGPPVLYTIQEDGTEVFRMEMLARTPRP